jgi:hypothetical protein
MSHRLRIRGRQVKGGNAARRQGRADKPPVALALHEPERHERQIHWRHVAQQREVVGHRVRVAGVQDRSGLADEESDVLLGQSACRVVPDP